jgi:hypothetical protein
MNRRKEKTQTGADSEVSIFITLFSFPLLVHSEPSLVLPFPIAVTLFFSPFAYSYTLKREAA